MDQLLGRRLEFQSPCSPRERFEPFAFEYGIFSRVLLISLHDDVNVLGINFHEPRPAAFSLTTDEGRS